MSACPFCHAVGRVRRLCWLPERWACDACHAEWDYAETDG